MGVAGLVLLAVHGGVWLMWGVFLLVMGNNAGRPRRSPEHLAACIHAARNLESRGRP